MNEAETRAEHIDPALKAAGWGVVEGSKVLREFHITQGRLQGAGRRAKAEIADYVLVYRNLKLAVVEAKAWDKPHSEGAAQAKLYATKLALRYTYATNGQAIYGIDMLTGYEGDVTSYAACLLGFRSICISLRAGNCAARIVDGRCDVLTRSETN